MATTYDYGKSSLSTATVNSVYGMIETLAQETVENAQPSHTLKDFNKGTVTYGTVIEDAIVKMATSSAFSSSATPFTKVNPALIVKIFKTWNKSQFSATVELDEIRKIVEGGTSDASVNKIAGDVVASLTLGSDQEDYENLKGALAGNKANMTAAFTATSTSTNDDLIKAIRDTVDAFKFANTTYCPAGIKSACPIERVRIVMPYTLKNKINVETLAHVLQLQEVDLMAKILETDATDKLIHIIDKNAVVDYCRLNEVTSQFNAAARYTNYFLTVDKMYGVSPLFKQTYLDCTALA